jgi:flagellar hook-associated protein 2
VANRDADGRARITASETHHIEVEATDSLDDIRKKINDLNVGYSASILVDGSNTPYRLSISSKQTGASGAFNIDLSAIGLSTETLSESKDAMIAYGDANQSTGLILRSSTNTFRGVINGMDLTIAGVSDTPVTITSASSNIDVKVSLQTFVENYNKFREELNVAMAFEVSATRGVTGHILWNSPIAKALDRDLTKMLQQTVTGIQGIRSLADLGITMRRNLDDGAHNRETGKLVFDEDKFEEAWRRDPEGVQKFFFDEREYPNSDGTTRKENVGWAQRFTDLADTFQGTTAGGGGKIMTRMDTLSTQIDRNDQRIEFMEQRLEFKRQMYLKQFYAMEQAMARMTSDMSAVGNIANAWQSNWGG